MTTAARKKNVSRFESTYEELKLSIVPLGISVNLCFESTYEELKL